MKLPAFWHFTSLDHEYTVEVALLQCISHAQQTWDQKHMCWDTIVLHHSNKCMMLHDEKTVCAMLLKINCLAMLVVKASVFYVAGWRLRKITTVTVWTCDIPSITMWLNLTWSATFSCHSTGAEVLLIYTCSYCKYKAVYIYLQLNRFRHFL